MTSPAPSKITVETEADRREGLERALSWTGYVLFGAVCLAVVLASGLYLRLVAGPLNLQEHSARISSALGDRIGPGWQVELRDANLELHRAKPAVQVAGLEIRNPAGVTVLTAPHAVVSLDPLSLLMGDVSPREIELRNLQVRALVAGDGSLAFVVQDASAPSLPASSPPPDTRNDARGRPSPLSTAIASLLEPLLRPTGVIGALDRATVTNAKFTLVGPDGRERAFYDRVGARFERRETGERRVELDLEGRHGAWQVRGHVRDGAERTGDLEALNVPLADLLLLGGLGDAPAGSKLKLDGRIWGALSGGRLSKLEGRFASSEGSIARPGRPALKVERAAGRAIWDEARRALTLAEIELRSGGSAIRLDGELSAGPAGENGAIGDWRLRLSGRDSVLSGLTAADPAVRIDALAAEISFGSGGVSLDRATIKGGDLDVALSGATLPDADGVGVRARIAVERTDVRRLLRLWPDVVAIKLRSFLVDALESGAVERLDLQANFDARTLKRALADLPIPPETIDIGLALRRGVLTFADGLPALRELSIDGKISGTDVKLTSRAGRVDMPEGRRLSFSEGSYSHADYDDKASLARIGFRVTGGADAFAAFLRSPPLREAGAPDLDPTAFKGRGDIRVSLPLAVHRIPDLADLPFSIQGSVADLSVEKILGREKVEGGQLALGYERGALSVKGDARISGSPASVDLQVPRNGPGAVAILLTLDEAARARRSLPVGPLLAGPVGVKATAALGSGAKAPVRVEVDLGKATVDNLVPGWTKAAGRPGRLSFQLVEGEGTELRDLVLDAGSAQFKGQVSLSTDGGLERADLNTFKLSPGDDLRAQVERTGAGYRVAIKGAVGDARPVLRWIGASGQTPGAARAAGRDAQDVDLDLAVNILTGHNDEALTGVSARLSARNRELRTLQLTGRTRGGPLEARLAKLDSGAPVLTVNAGDAGATLRFLDVYRRMVGGKLALDARMSEAGQEGNVTIDSFKLRSEPALNLLVSEAVPVGSEDRNGGQAERINPNDVQFVKLTGGFRRGASRIEYQDVVIWGPQVGFNLSGSVDYGRDRTDIHGTFVPAYTLNNAFSQVPVIGLILGGGKNEGLFALDFRISGQASSPTVTVNPLSAVAPGILRKLFGWMLPEGGEATDTTATGATRPTPPAVTPAER